MVGSCRAVALAGLAVLALYGSTFLRKLPAARSLPSDVRVLEINHADLAKCLSRAFGFEGHIEKLGLIRNGRAMIVVGTDVRSSSTTVMTISNQGFSRTDAPSRVPFFDEQGKVIAWSTNMNERVLFEDGTSIETAGRAFVMDPLGFYVRTDSNGWCWVGRIEQRKEVQLVGSFRPYQIVHEGKSIYVFGSRAGSGAGFVLLNEETFEGGGLFKPLPAPPIAVTADGSWFLLRSNSDQRPKLLAYESASRTTLDLGKMPLAAFFVATNTRPAFCGTRLLPP